MATSSVALAQTGSSQTLQTPPPPLAIPARVPTITPTPLAPELDFARADPSVVFGVLPNGLRYAILTRPSHGRESIQLRILAGSRDETITELGVAHFLEHMAFNGSRNFQPATVMHRFSEAGMALGHDQNAHTGYFYTTYELDMPEVDKAKLDLGFLWLHDVADGLSLDQGEVNRERGVVLSEYRLQQGPNWESASTLEHFKLPDLRGPLRPPIGTEPVLKIVRASDIRAFYQRWYRPDRAILVAVGETPAEDVKARIEASFGGWRASGPAPEHPAEGKLQSARGPDALTLAQPDLAPFVQVCRLSDRDRPGPQSVASRKAELADSVWNLVMNRRLAALRRSDKPPFAAGVAYRQNDYNTVLESCLSAVPFDKDWSGALAVLSTEARRMEAYGPTPEELREAITNIVGSLNHKVTSYSAETPAEVAPVLLDALTEGRTFDTPVEERRIQFRALSTIDATIVRDAFRRRWTQAHQPLVALQTSTKTPDIQLAEAWRADQNLPAPDKPVDEKPPVWAYASFGPPGKLVERQVLTNPDFVRFRFANGVVANFKQTTLTRGEVLIRVRFGGGGLELPAGRDFAAKLGAGALLEGGFGKNNMEDLVHLCTGRSCNATLTIEREHFLLDGSVTSSANLAFEMQVLAGVLSDPGFRPSMDANIPVSVRSSYRQWSISPPTMASLALLDVMQPPRPMRQPPMAEAMAYRHQDFEQLLRGPLTRDAIEVSVVGDIDEGHVLAVLQTTFGALAPRDASDRIDPKAPRVRFPKTAPPPVTVFHDGPKDQAAVLVSWPLFRWTPELRHDTNIAYFTAQMLQNALIDEIRQRLGKTYAPAAIAQTFRGGDDGSFLVAVVTTPDSAKAVAAAVRSISLDFAQGRITADALERARKPIADNDAKARTYNSWWLDTLDGTYFHPDRIDQTRQWDKDMTAITLDEIRALSAKWLTPQPVVIYALPCATREPCHKEVQDGPAQ